MADVTAQRAAIAETRARIDAALAELTDHVPEREDLQATAMKYGGAVVSAVIGVGLVVLVTKSRLHRRRTRSDARTYASAVVKAMPEVAAAYVGHNADRAVTAMGTAPRRGVGSAVLMGVGVVGGVAIAQAVGRGQGTQV